MIAKTEANPPGTIFWFAPGVHKLGGGADAQIVPRDGDVYVGAPGAVLDGQRQNSFAFTQRAKGVVVSYLEIRNFAAPRNTGVVNRDSGDSWSIEHNTIHDNNGAALMAGARQETRGNCLRDNGQYGMNAYQEGDGITGLIFEGNEVTGNNTDDWERRIPECGCSGGVKFWAVNGADVRNNWIHDNRGPGLWADTNNNDFLIEKNLIERNDGPAIWYEISYNATIRGNVILENAIEYGREFQRDEDPFPVGAIYLSEAGGEPRIPARTGKIDVYENLLERNWSGITAWEDAGRFCNSPSSTTEDCTLVVGRAAAVECVPPAIASEPLYSDCRWKTENVDIHDNVFRHDRSFLGESTDAFAGRMALISNAGTEPAWSPYMGDVIQRKITLGQNVVWRDNVYYGQWSFTLFDMGRTFGWDGWRALPYAQDVGSSYVG
ncbi:right-handed parallel beta-helix repeat-containing protein [Pseudonocardia yuanmonensis]|uniref:right-handed parallel beta-helix repeat-containing protein n=1 Tax=Pseudonocardia yuanmonensis TaxID=1095914 RepID=UPI0031E69320